MFGQFRSMDEKWASSTRHKLAPVARERSPLLLGDADGEEGPVPIRCRVAVDVEVGEIGGDADDGDDAAVRHGLPGILTGDEGGRGHRQADREAKEVVDVKRHRAREHHGARPHGRGLVGRELGCIGVAARRRQRARHRFLAMLAHRDFCGADGERRDREQATVVEHERRADAAREEHRRLARAVSV